MTHPQRESIERLETVSALARDVSTYIMTLRRRGLTVTEKADHSVVTNADSATEDVIKAALAKLTPEIPVVAEESVAAGNVPAACSTYWLVDPIDGTQDFAAGGAQFAVHIGLIQSHRPILGVVAFPALGKQYHARLGGGAWRMDGASGSRITCASSAVDRLRIVVSKNCIHRSDFKSWHARHLESDVTSFGSSVKFMQVAEGQADIYPRFTPSMEWDTAAPHIIVNEAGGILCDPEGRDLLYSKPNFKNPGFICCTPHALPKIRWGT